MREPVCLCGHWTHVWFVINVLIFWLEDVFLQEKKFAWIPSI